MIIKKDSPFRNLPDKLNRKQILLFDGIRLSVEMIDFAYNRLYKNLSSLSAKAIDVPKQEISDACILCWIDIWNIIDSGYRLRQLLQSFPSLKQNDPILQLFYRNTEIFEKTRHIIQHIRTEIDNYIKADVPIFGVLSWVYNRKEKNKFKIFTLSPGSFYLGVRNESLLISNGEKFKDNISKITLKVLNQSIQLDIILDRITPVISGIELNMKKQFINLPSSGSDTLCEFNVECFE